MKGRIGTFCCILVVSVFLLCTFSFAVTQLSAQGTVVKVVGTVIFLDQSPEAPFYLGATSVLKGISMTTLSQLVGRSVSITYHVMGQKNVIDSLDVAE